jgi:ankyrin repeat protein
MQTSHVDRKDPNSQKAIRHLYQQAPNAIITQTEERYLHLLEAINQRNETSVKEILSMDTSLLKLKHRGATAGGLAAAKGHLEILKMIIEAGVDVNINPQDPWIHQALRNGHFPTAEFLVESGADFSRVNEIPSLKERFFVYNLDGAAAGDLAAAKGILNLLKIIVAAGVDVNINTSDPWLHQTLRNKNFLAAEFLIKSGADIDAKSSENQTAFEAAVLRGCEKSISLLHQSGADMHPGSGSKAQVTNWKEGLSLFSSLRLRCKLGEALAEDKILDLGETDWQSNKPVFVAYEFYSEHIYILGLGSFAIAKFLLDHGAQDLLGHGSQESFKVRRVLPTVEVLTGYGHSRSIHEIPRSCEEPATTVLSTINYDNNSMVQLLLEERASSGGRYLWERVVYKDYWYGETSTRVVRLLSEWGRLGSEKKSLTPDR